MIAETGLALLWFAAALAIIQIILGSLSLQAGRQALAGAVMRGTGDASGSLFSSVDLKF